LLTREQIERILAAAIDQARQAGTPARAAIANAIADIMRALRISGASPRDVAAAITAIGIYLKSLYPGAFNERWIADAIQAAMKAAGYTASQMASIIRLLAGTGLGAALAAILWILVFPGGAGAGEDESLQLPPGAVRPGYNRPNPGPIVGTPVPTPPGYNVPPVGGYWNVPPGYVPVPGHPGWYMPPYPSSGGDFGPGDYLGGAGGPWDEPGVPAPGFPSSGGDFGPGNFGSPVPPVGSIGPPNGKPVSSLAMAAQAPVIPPPGSVNPFPPIRGTPPVIPSPGSVNLFPGSQSLTYPFGTGSPFAGLSGAGHGQVGIMPNMANMPNMPTRM